MRHEDSKLEKFVTQLARAQFLNLIQNISTIPKNRRHARHTWNRLIKMSMSSFASEAIFTARFQLAPLQPLLTLFLARIISLDVQTTKGDISRPP